MKHKYGSKAAYIAARKERNMTEEERTKKCNAERLSGTEEMMTWSLFVAACLSSGASPAKAAKEADAVIALARERFT